MPLDALNLVSWFLVALRCANHSNNSFEPGRLTHADQRFSGREWWEVRQQMVWEKWEKQVSEEDEEQREAEFAAQRDYVANLSPAPDFGSLQREQVFDPANRKLEVEKDRKQQYVRPSQSVSNPQKGASSPTYVPPPEAEDLEMLRSLRKERRNNDKV